MIDIPELFNSMVFSDKVMKERLNKATFDALQKTKETGAPLDKNVANEIAECMKNWALEKGATHFTHWFQPMTGITAEKHDSFITPHDGGIIMKFSGKELIKGEPDASSFPSGGLRSTFEARGYTAWDVSSYAFIKDNTLCIPTAFISYSGQVLDKKTPLLRSMKLLTSQVARVLNAANMNSKNIEITVGAEQEYFLVDRDLYLKRKDLILCGKTLFGARPPKGQDMSGHYFGTIRPRVLSYMEDLDRELWKLGILAKTRHNEAAPAQHELAPVFCAVNVATDHNQLTMEVMKRLAEKHGLVCLLNEKPFRGVNGSGKHNNWSISVNGENLLEPTKNPEQNDRFLLFLSAIIRSVDLHSDLLRLSVASAGNDHRLGGHEAPPAIISIYLGENLTDVLAARAGEKTYNAKTTEKFKVGVNSIPEFALDTADRNRTSPLAFTGNKFEFRMLGSSFNIACTNMMINTIVADTLSFFAARIEAASDKNAEIKKIIADTYKQHKRIIFNGNNYSTEWHLEAEKRGLLNLSTSPDALIRYSREENVELFGRHNIFTREEVVARQDILLENYSKVIQIESFTMADMVYKDIIPASVNYLNDLTSLAEKKKAMGIVPDMELSLINKISSLTWEIYPLVEKLTDAAENGRAITDPYKQASYYCKNVVTLEEQLRYLVDKLELIVSAKHWQIPTYSDLLFGV